MASGLEKQVKENGDKLPAQIKGELEEGVKKAQELLKDGGASKEALKAESEKLTKLLEQAAKFFQEAAQASQAAAGAQQPQPGAGQASEAPKNDAVDADFEVVDDDNSKKPS